MSKKFEKEEAYKAWEFVKTKDDVIMWHTIYTPWFTTEQIKRIVELYEPKKKEPKKEELKQEESEFQKLWKISK